MTESEIIEGNRLIAEFMQLQESKGVMGDTRRYFKIDYYHDSLIAPEDHFSYHTSWDWLMPVVEKISDMRPISPDRWISFEIMVNGYVKISGTGEKIFTNVAIEKSVISATWKAVIQFIKWYNQNK